MLSDLRELILPLEPSFRDAMRRVHARRPDLRAFARDPDGVEFAKWCATFGPHDSPADLGASRAGSVLPPDEVRGFGSCGASAASYLRSGIDDFEAIVDVVEEFGGRPVTDLETVLDFACGSGRISRWFVGALPDATVTGIDVHPAGVRWCAEHLDGTFLIGPPRPPLPLASGSQDLIVCISLFTHLTREACDSWLAELLRVCRPGGLIALTINGTRAILHGIRDPDFRAVVSMDLSALREALRTLHQRTFVHHAIPADVLAAFEGPTTDYGVTFLTHRFVEEQWTRSAELLGIVPAHIQGIQDLVVLRAR